MQEIIGVKFRNASKVYYFDPKDLDIHYNDHVIVETVRGIEFGTVVLAPMMLADDKVPQPLREVLRIADAQDIERETENRIKEKEAYKICRQKILERGLEMKLIQAEYTFDNSKVLFYFTADGRIDFRDLVKDLAGIFRTRIELRQIGVRDETKILGGIGICGRPLCCHTYLSEFAPVSIKMAKEQNLSLNPTKISGCCGRLMCCLKNEADTYAYLNKGLPARGDQMTAPDGRHGEVQSVDILRQRVKCVVDMDNDERELVDYHVSEITFIPHSKRPKNQQGAASKNEKPVHGKDRSSKTFEEASEFETDGQENAGENSAPKREEEEPASSEKNGKDRSRNRKMRVKKAAMSGNEAEQSEDRRTADTDWESKNGKSDRGEKAGRNGRYERSNRGDRTEKAPRYEKSGADEEKAGTDQTGSGEVTERKEGEGQEASSKFRKRRRRSHGRRKPGSEGAAGNSGESV